jgi:hypothetical protein
MRVVRYGDNNIMVLCFYRLFFLLCFKLNNKWDLNLIFLVLLALLTRSDDTHLAKHCKNGNASDPSPYNIDFSYTVGQFKLYDDMFLFKNLILGCEIKID